MAVFFAGGSRHPEFTGAIAAGVGVGANLTNLVGLHPGGRRGQFGVQHSPVTGERAAAQSSGMLTVSATAAATEERAGLMPILAEEHAG